MEDRECVSAEQRQRARNEIHQIANSAILAITGPLHTCNRTPGWRRVAFINMTDTSYDCSTGDIIFGHLPLDYQWWTHAILPKYALATHILITIVFLHD
jgi:hypothetical protein